MKPAQKPGNFLAIVADIGLAIGLAIDEPRHHHARFGVHQFRGETGRVSSARRHDLAVAADVMKWKIPAKANHIALACISDNETLVAQAAMQRRHVNASLPDRQCLYSSFLRRDLGHWITRAWRACARSTHRTGGRQ